MAICPLFELVETTADRVQRPSQVQRVVIAGTIDW